MIVYNNMWLKNLQVRKQADEAVDASCISKTEKDQIYQAYPVGFYTPNIYVRIGLFILTMIIVQFSLGLVSLMFLTAVHEKAMSGLFIFFGLLIYGGLEFMIKKGHYKSGVDDALMWMAAGSLLGGLNTMVSISWLANSFIVFIMAVYLFLRFTNALMACIAFLAILAIAFLGLIRLGTVGKAITPFVLMAVSALCYAGVQYLRSQKPAELYARGLLLVRVTALICFYTAGNYLVVREATVAMFNLKSGTIIHIPFGWLFWIFTVAIPLLYIIRGLQTKDAVLFRTGLLLVAAIVFTVRHYYHLLPAETMMVMAGAALIAIAYALIRYLQEPRHGFTYKEPLTASFMDSLQLESLVIAQSFGGTQLPADAGTQFGGGTGGGGGASGGF